MTREWESSPVVFGWNSCSRRTWGVLWREWRFNDRTRPRWKKNNGGSIQMEVHDTFSRVFLGGRFNDSVSWICFVDQSLGRQQLRSKYPTDFSKTSWESPEKIVKSVKRLVLQRFATNERARNQKNTNQKQSTYALMVIKTCSVPSLSSGFGYTVYFFFVPLELPKSPAPNLDRKDIQSTLAHTKEVGLTGRSIALNIARPGFCKQGTEPVGRQRISVAVRCRYIYIYICMMM